MVDFEEFRNPFYGINEVDRERFLILGQLIGISFFKCVHVLGLDPKRSFKCSNLSGIEFGKVDLSEFDFRGADLSGSDLSGSTGLNVDRLEGCRWDYQTRLSKEVEEDFFNLELERGNTDALVALGMILERKQAVSPALELYEKAASLGNSHAMALFAHVHMEGRGIERDLEKALIWYRDAAENGHTAAMFNLAVNLEQGVGVDAPDPQEAMRWYRKAADKGHTGAMVNLALNLEQGVGVDAPDPQEAMRWFREAAESGRAGAMVNLALNLQQGVGVDEPKPQAAMNWYREAAEKDHTAARRHIAAMVAIGEVDPSGLADEASITPLLIAPAGEWAGTPPVPGVWRDCDVAKISEIAGKLARAAVLRGESGVFASLKIAKVRCLAILCYPGLELADVQFVDADGDVCFLSALISTRGAVFLDGRSSGLHAINPNCLSLANTAAAEAYLRLFCAFVHGEEGPFRIIDSVDEVPLADRTSSWEIAGASIRAPQANGVDDDDRWIFSTRVLYGDELFESDFAVAPDGMVKMLDGRSISSNLRVLRSNYRGPLRTPLALPG